MNHRLRTPASDEDQRFVQSLAGELGLPVVIGVADISDSSRSTGIEARARAQRYAFIRKTCAGKGVRRVLVAHTADDQVETVLMRIFEGAGISGLKGIPLAGEGGIERPLLGVWRREIIESLEKSGQSYRIDESNQDIRFERNWVRHVLLPLLTARYGDTVKKRIHALGERFRELDAFIGKTASRWIRRNAKGAPPGFQRSAFAALPSAIRIAALQLLVHEHAGKSANERLLLQLDRMILTGKPSAALRVGHDTLFRNSYGRTSILPAVAPVPEDARSPGSPVVIPSGAVGRFPFQGNGSISIEVTLVSASRGRGDALPPVATQDRTTAFFDLSSVSFPLIMSPLAAGDTVDPYGGSGSRKAKEIMIDMKIPRETRWGRATVRDSAGRILWIPGVVRSDIAPVTGRTRKLLCLNVLPM